MSDSFKIRRALISVWDKTGVVDFARALHDEFGVEIISTGGTARTLREAGIPVTLVETLTGCGEMLDGRVKTLHPAIHAAILADRDNPEHMRQLEATGIKPIDLVVVNLYPFEKTVADPNCTFEQAIEMIDIGGVALLRAAAKNHRHVAVVSSAAGLAHALHEFRANKGAIAASRIGSELDVHFDVGFSALAAFWATSVYDDTIASWMSTQVPDSLKPAFRTFFLRKLEDLRYGENAHQTAETLSYLPTDESGPDLTAADAEWIGEQPTMSYNNYLDADAALGLCTELTRATRRAKLCFAPPAAVSDRSAKLRFATSPAKATEPEAKSARRPAARFAPVTREIRSRRNLPHWQIPGASYWITFTSRIGELSPAERDIAFAAVKHWDGKRIDLHAAVVMPDHVHALVTPRPIPGRPDAYENLSALTKSIKSYSGRLISAARGGIGRAWVHECFDHWIRGDEEFRQKWEYIAENVVKEGLAATPPEYRWWYALDYFDLGIGTPVKADEPRLAMPERKAELCTTRHDPESKAELCTTGLAHVVCFIKHTNPCGVGVASDPVEAYRRAYLGDPNAAMGGILAVDFPVTAEFAAVVMESFDRFGKPLREAGAANAPGGFFVEVWVAPSFDDDAVAIIRGTAGSTAALPNPPKKKWGQNVRLLAVGDMTTPPDPTELQYRSIAGGMLVQSPDLLGLNEEQWRVVTKRAPTERERADLRLAWLICKHTKSNAITLVQDGRLLGNGAGQMSRMMSCRVATWLARENGHLAGIGDWGLGIGADQAADPIEEGKSARALNGPVAASDAFFPFADGPRILMDAGVTAIIQPGGSKRDDETIAACDERSVAMIFTGARHFRH